jgi:FkbM family methyltransferase
MLTTKSKVALAGLAYRFISLGRRAAGQGNQVVVRRGGFRWSLDLNEGIDFSIYLLGGFEKSTARTLRQLVKPGDVTFDIGANVGAHTLGLADSVGRSGRVFAFEPSEFAYAKLKTNLALNPPLALRTEVMQLMLRDSAAGKAQPEIYASWPLATSAALHPKHRGRLVPTTGAAVDTLDRFVEHTDISRLNLVKLDVDGHELPVLRGGFSVLTRLRPILVMELSPYIHAEERNSFPELVRLLAHAGYSIEELGTRRKLPLDAVQLEGLVPDGASINVIARP